jgi:hypothetical protein
VHRQTAPERDRAQKLLAEVGQVILRGGHNVSELPIINVYTARGRARRGDRDDALPLVRAARPTVREDNWWRSCDGCSGETPLDRGPITRGQPRPRRG